MDKNKPYSRLKNIFVFSLCLNVIFIFFFGFLFFKSDRIKTIKQAIFPKKSEPKLIFKPNYYIQKSHFEALPDTNNEIVFLGDSFTDFGRWSELFDRDGIKNRGIGGDRTDGVLGRLNEVLRATPDKIFLMIGYNDLSRGVPLENIVSNYRKILQLIRKQSPGTRVYVQSVLPVNDDHYRVRTTNEDISRLNRHLKDLSVQYSAEYIDLFETFRDSSGQLSSEFAGSDGLHVNGKGYQRWKSIIIDYLDN
jgi:lysophospholipase L1-like esterase